MDNNSVNMGMPFNSNAKPVKEVGSRITAGVLAIFFGIFGVHKFYLGQKGKGLLYLVFFWTCIPWIVGLIEGFKYLWTTDEIFERSNNVVLVNKTKDGMGKKVAVAIGGVVLVSACVLTIINPGDSNGSNSNAAKSKPVETEEVSDTVSYNSYTAESVSEYDYAKMVKCTENLDKNSKEYEEYFGMWLGFQLIGKPIETKDELKTAWELSQEEAYIPDCKIYMQNLVKVADLFSLKNEYENKYYDSWKALVKKNYDEELLESNIDYFIETFETSDAFIDDKAVKEKVDGLETILRQYKTSLPATTDASLTSEEINAAKNRVNLMVDVLSRVKKSKGGLTIAGLKLTSDYTDEYSCFDLDSEEEIICVFNGSPSRGTYSGEFYYAGTDTYVDGDGFEENLDVYCELPDGLVERYEQYKQNQDSAAEKTATANKKFLESFNKLA